MVLVGGRQYESSLAIGRDHVKIMQGGLPQMRPRGRCDRSIRQLPRQVILSPPSHP